MQNQKSAEPEEIDVLCVGHASWDIFLYVDEYPVENSKQLLSESGESAGGPALNASALLARWRLRCDFAGAAGNDPYGLQILKTLQDDGAGIQALELRQGSSTALSVVMVHKHSGSRTILTRRRGSGVYALPESYLRTKRPRFILMDGHEPEASRQAMLAFPEAVTILDAGGYRQSTISLAAEADYLVASERFAAERCGEDSLVDDRQVITGLQALAEMSSGRIAVTLGERGCAFLQDGNIRRIRGVPVRAEDTTAAGDIFHGAFVYGLHTGREFDESLDFANWAASISVTKRGGHNSIPALEDIEARWDSSFY